MKVEIKKTNTTVVVIVEQNFTLGNHSVEKVTTSRLRKKLSEEHDLDITRCVKNDSIVYPETTGTWEFLLKEEPILKKEPVLEKKPVPKEENVIDLDLNSLKLIELKKLAKNKGIRNTSKLSKVQLLRTLSEQG